MIRHLSIFLIAPICSLFLLLSCEEAEEIPGITVTVTQPGHYTMVSELVTITCEASADNGIAKVELWIDGIYTGQEDTSEPYSFEWNTSQYEEGSQHVIIVRAYDVNNNTADSDSIIVTVTNQGSLPETPSLYPVEVDIDGYTLRWTQNHDEDFGAYDLYVASDTSMSDSTLVHSFTTVTDTVHQMTGLVEDEVRYYQVITRDLYGLKAGSNIEAYFISSAYFLNIFSGSVTGSYYSARSVQQTSDGGYILAGKASSAQNGYGDFLLIKTNEYGIEEWTRTFGGTQFDEATCVQQTSDGGYILTGNSNSYGSGELDFWLVKTDADGSREWAKTFGGSNNDHATSVKQTSDGGYILAGYTDSFGSGPHNAWLVKTDASGNEEWNNTYGDLADEEIHSVRQTSDGGYIAAGMFRSPDSGSTMEAWMLKIDALGTEAWDQSYGGDLTEAAYDIQQTSDGGYILAALTTTFGIGVSEAWLIKTDASGTEEWNNTLGGVADDYVRSVQQTSDGGYVIAGFTTSFGNGECDVWLVKTDAGGNEEWSQTFGNGADDRAYSVQQTSDGGYVLAGNYSSYDGSTPSGAWLIKTDNNGHAEQP